MAERLGEALLDIDTKDKAFNRGVDRAERKALGLGRTFDLTSAKALKLGRNLALAAAAGTAALGLLVKRTIDHADAMSKAAARSGTTTEALSRLAWAGDLSDVSLETLTGSIYRLSNAMAQAASGKDKDLQAIFKGLGIEVTDTAGRLRSADQVLMDFADVFASLENGAEKTALAVKVFGRSGAALIPLLNNGRQGLAGMADEADRLGLTISTKMGQDAEKFNDTITRIGALMRGMVVQIAGDMLPALQDFADKLADPAFRQDAQEMAADIVAAFGLIADAIRTVLGLIEDVGEAWKTAKGWVEWANNHTPLGEKIDQPFGFGNGTITPIDKSGPDRFGDTFGAAETNANRTFSGALPGAPRTKPTPQRQLPPSLSSLLGGSGSGSGASELERQKQAVLDLIAALKDEQAILRTSDPVQKEMIRNRQVLAAATPQQAAEIERLIGVTMREREALASIQDAFQTFGDMSVDAIDGLLDSTDNLGDSLEDVAKSLRRMVLQAELLGQGPLAQMFGMSAPAGGGPGGLFGALTRVITGGLGGGGGIGGAFAGMYATGGLIPNGKFGIVGDAGPEPVIGTSRGAMVLPNSTLRNMEARKDGFQFNQTIQPPDGFETRTREENTPGGKRQEVYFEEMVGSAIGRPGNAQSAVRNVGRLTRR